MADSTEVKWLPLSEGYCDEFGSIDLDVYRAAGELWPSAEIFGRVTIHDAAAAQRILLKVAAQITQKRSAGSIAIGSLKSYLMKAYKRAVLEELQRIRSHSASAAAILAQEEKPPNALLEEIILLRQVVSRMDREARQIFELLALGHSFEEIGRMLGKRSNSIRSKYSKQLKKLRRQLTEEKE